MNIYKKNIFTSNKILILDFGSQYSQLIARKIREIGVYCEIMSYDSPKEKIQDFSPKGIILSGGPKSVYQKNRYSIPNIVFDLHCPILGICYGMQILTLQLNGKVEKANIREFGNTIVQIYKKSPILKNIPKDFFQVWMSHTDNVIKIPKDFQKIASTKNSPYTIIENRKKNFYGIQFHPEVSHTEYGSSILKNFLNISNCTRTWKKKNIVENLIKGVHKKIKKNKVILGLSGGIDSLVTALIIKKAIEKKLICIFVNNGLLRIKQEEEIKKINKTLKLNIIYINAKKKFLEKLDGVSDPEKKRKIIGKLFIEIFQKEADKKNIKWLAQGTIYPDIIESAKKNHISNKAEVIKSHHNVGGLPKNMKLYLLEPLKNLFKDEVYAIAKLLGLSDNFIYQHPFPGPGLAIRIAGKFKIKYLKILKKADYIFIKILKKKELYQKINQAFAVFLPVKSVGIIGDKRQYEYIIVLRAIKTIDFMTANISQIPYEILEEISQAIINQISNISRVLYDITNKPPATIEWE